MTVEQSRVNESVTQATDATSGFSRPKMPTAGPLSIDYGINGWKSDQINAAVEGAAHAGFATSIQSVQDNKGFTQDILTVAAVEDTALWAQFFTAFNKTQEYAKLFKAVSAKEEIMYQELFDEPIAESAQQPTSSEPSIASRAQRSVSSQRTKNLLSDYEFFNLDGLRAAFNGIAHSLLHANIK